jgi:protein-disulfide isomerase
MTVESTEPDRLNDNAYFTIKKSTLLAWLMPVALVVGALGGYYAGRVGALPASSAASETRRSSAPDGSVADQPYLTDGERYYISADDDPFLGEKSAPITIIEFSDYECPYCQQFHLETFSRLLEEYGGHIRFVYRDFPITPVHDNALPAAIAANCAGELGDYWDFHDGLFRSEGLGRDAYVQLAASLGVDLPAFEACIDGARYSDEVLADLDYAYRLGVNATPTFFINGILLVGAQPFENFEAVILQELQRLGINP